MRGSRNYSRRKLESTREAEPDVKVPVFPRDLDKSAKAILKKYDLAKLIITEIPNYDPWAHGANKLYRFHKVKAARVIAFFHTQLVHTGDSDMYGKPFKLLPHQMAFLALLFGMVHKSGPRAGLRRYRRALYSVGRGGGKSPLAAGICLYFLFCENRKGCTLYTAATDVEEAMQTFQPCVDMVRANPKLAAIVGNGIYKDRIVVDDRDSLRLLSGKIKDSRRGDLCVLDECHEQDSKLYSSLDRSLKRGEPLMIMLSTAGFRLGEFFHEQCLRAEDICKGTVKDLTFLPAYWRASEASDISSVDTWKSANPGYPIVPTHEYLEDQHKQVQVLPSQMAHFLTKHLNRFTISSNAWIPDDKWAQTNRGKTDIDLLKKSGPCYAGIDGSIVADLFCLALYWPKIKTVKVWTWLPHSPNGNTIEQVSERDRAEYPRWAREGYLSLLPGTTIEPTVIRDSIRAILDEYKPEKVGVDEAKIREVIGWLIEQRYPLERFKQGKISFNDPTQQFERLAVAGELVNADDNPVLTYCVRNVRIILDNTATSPLQKPAKQSASSCLRIDAATAAIMALGMAIIYYRDKKTDWGELNGY